MNIVSIIYLALAVFMIAAVWKVFVKAGRPGWGCIIPIYNIYLLTQIGRKPGWWVILFFIPIANLIASILVCIGIAENFGKSAGFGLGLFFLGIVFYPILAFGEANYIAGAAPPAPPMEEGAWAPAPPPPGPMEEAPAPTPPQPTAEQPPAYPESTEILQ